MKKIEATDWTQTRDRYAFMRWLEQQAANGTPAAFVEDAMLYSEGPETFLHWYDAILPSASVPLPESVTLLAGRVITWLDPAFAVGG